MEIYRKNILAGGCFGFTFKLASAKQNRAARAGQRIYWTAGRLGVSKMANQLYEYGTLRRDNDLS
jgi:hypothetical protein